MVYDVNGNVLVQIDDTLTVAGAAADAKATGNAIGELKSALSDISDSTRNINTSSAGRYSVNQNTGVITKNAESTTTFGMSEPVAIEPETVYTVSFYGIGSSTDKCAVYLAYYDSTKTYLSGARATNLAIVGKKTFYTFTTPENAEYIAASIYASGLTLSNENIQIEVGSTSTEYVQPLTAKDISARESIDSIQSTMLQSIAANLNSGYYNANGTIAVASDDKYEKYTDKIYAKTYSKIDYALTFSSSVASWLAVCTWDSAGTFSRTVLINNVTGTVFTGTFSISDDIEYVAFTFRSYNEDALSLTGTIAFSSFANVVERIPVIDRNSVLSSVAVNVNRFRPFYDHLFIDKISGVNVTIPSESLFNIHVSRRLGFDMIEANVQPTSDGHYIVMHGVSGKFGAQVEHIDGSTDISNTAINTVTLSWIQENVRYKSLYAKYRVCPPTLEEFLFECRKNCMIPLVTCRDAGALAIVKEIMGEGNFVAYNGTRETTSATIMTYPSLSTKEEILALCETFGKPYMYCMANPTDFTDSELLEIVGLLHTNGYWIGYAGSYVSETESQRLLALGFDFCASKYQVNDFENGNLCNLSADIDYSDFATTGSVSDNLLTLAVGDTITPATIPNSLFLGKGSLHILFSGSITVKLGRYIDSAFSSDGSHAMWFSTYFINETPTFTLTATDATDIISIDYRASKV
jgi:hypothetical protein